MPTTLDNGLTVYNVTPHDLYFCTENEDGVIVAPSDEVVNAQAYTQDITRTSQYKLVTVTFNPLPEGREIIQRIKRENPDALIVGSIVAAQAYPGEVVSPVPCKPVRKMTTRFSKLVRMDRFTIYTKKENE